MTVYLFDMDGTITPPRLPMEELFAMRFLPWLNENRAFIVTGSNMEKVQEQVNNEVLKAFGGVYCSMGNDLWAKGELVYHRDFTPEKELLDKLEEFRKNTKYPYTTYDNYIEKRTGMINFSVLGRDCPYRERERYFTWDQKFHERETIREELVEMFPSYDFVLGGTISLDVIKKGGGKEQVAEDLRNRFEKEKIVFLGDRTYSGGDDYELANALRKMENTQVVQVDSPKQVLQFLEII